MTRPTWGRRLPIPPRFAHVASNGKRPPIVRKSGVAALVLSLALAAAAEAAPPVTARPVPGSGPFPEIQISTSSLDFGNRHIGGSTSQELTISNLGEGMLNVDLVVSGDDPSRFVVEDPTEPFQVSPGGQVGVTITYYPNTVETHSAYLDVYSNDPANPWLSVSLSGSGYEANLLSLVGTPDPVAPNGTATFTLTLDAPAGPGDVTVQITTSATALFLVPPEVTVLKDETSTQFNVTAGPVPGTETIYALYNTYFTTDEITIQAGAGADGAPPSALALGPVQPSPVRREAQVGFALPADGRVRLTVFDLAGRNVATLVDGVLPAGRHQVPWRPDSGPGLYFLRLESPGQARMLKAIVAP